MIGPHVHMGPIKIQEVQSAFLPAMSTRQYPNISVNNRTQDRCQDPNWKSVGRSPTNLSIHRHSYMSAILTRSSSSSLLALAGALYITGTHNSAINTLSLRSVQNHRCVKTNTFDHFNQYFRQEWSWTINCSHSDPKYIALDVIDLNKHKSRCTKLSLIAHPPFSTSSLSSPSSSPLSSSGCWPEVLLWWPSARGRQRSPVIRSLLSTQLHSAGISYFVFVFGTLFVYLFKHTHTHTYSVFPILCIITFCI